MEGYHRRLTDPGLQAIRVAEGFQPFHRQGKYISFRKGNCFRCRSGLLSCPHICLIKGCAAHYQYKVRCIVVGVRAAYGVQRGCAHLEHFHVICYGKLLRKFIVARYQRLRFLIQFKLTRVKRSCQAVLSVLILCIIAARNSCQRNIGFSCCNRDAELPLSACILVTVNPVVRIVSIRYRLLIGSLVQFMISASGKSRHQRRSSGISLKICAYSLKHAGVVRDRKLRSYRYLDRNGILILYPVRL